MYFSKKRMAIAVALIISASGLIYAGIGTVIQSRDLYKNKNNSATQIKMLADDNTAATPKTQKNYKDKSADELLEVYPQYWAALRAAETDDDLIAGAFLRQQNTDESYLTERVRNQWLKSLAKRDQWTEFNREFSKLDPAGTDQEVLCYSEFNKLSQNNTVSKLASELASSDQALTVGCNALINLAVQKGQIQKDIGWQRVRALLGNNRVSVARTLATSLGSPLPANLGGNINSGTYGDMEGALFAASSPNAVKSGSASSKLYNLDSSFSREQIAFVWGKIGLSEAKKQNANAALDAFAQSDPKQLNVEQWEWWARSALRVEDWNTLFNIITKMPAELQSSNTWQYWLARCYQRQGKKKEAEGIWRYVGSTGRNYYAVLSLEELGQKINTRSNTSHSSTQAINEIKKEPAISRAIALFNASNSEDRADLREDARREWRYSMRHKTEDQLLASATLAERAGFLEMAIYSADRTNSKIDYSLRYLSPYKNITQKHANNLGLDSAWVYGLIRQESRFIIGARSHVGASGLMQLMPSTAKWVAGKMGMNGGYDINDINTNIQMGTWYLNYVHNSLGHEVMATAGYNAGPGRARAWRANRSLEGAIYAETIPFNETRDYVQKVMTNSVYYADLFGQSNTSLKARMGTVPGK